MKTGCQRPSRSARLRACSETPAHCRSRRRPRPEGLVSGEALISASLPVPLLEQVGDRIPKTGQQIFAFQKSSTANQLALRERMANLDRFGFRINDPSPSGAAGEEIPQPFVNLSPRVVGRQDIDCEVGRAGEEALFLGLKPE